MNNHLVFAKRNDVYTDTFIIAEGTGNEHRAIRQLIRTYEKQFETLGTLCISNVKSSGGRPEQYYELNEPQASFLMTLLRNSPIVVEFKLRLVEQFFYMRTIIIERRSSHWQTARLKGKETRLDETDVIRDKLIPLAISQGSTNYEKFYMTYSKLVNSVLKINSDMRDSLPYHYLTTIDMLERIIENIISAEVDKGTHYKEIYQICKAKCNIAVELSFLPKLEPLKLAN